MNATITSFRSQNWSLIISLVTFAFSLVPQAAEVKSLSLDECFEIALENNLTVQIERINPELGLYNLKASQGVYDPSFFFRYNYFDSQQAGRFNTDLGLEIPGSTTRTDAFASGINGLLPTGGNVSIQSSINQTVGDNFNGSFEQFAGRTTALQLTQPLLKNFWIDGPRLSIRLAKNQINQSELTFQWRTMNTLVQIELAYYDLIFAQENVKVQEKAVQLAEQLLSENKKRVEIGTMAPLDEKQAESQVASRRADLLSASRNLIVSQNALKNLLSDEYTQWAEVTIEPKGRLTAQPVLIDLQTSWDKGMSARPDLKEFMLALENQGIRVKFLRNQLFPQLDVFGSIGYNAGNAASYRAAFRQMTDRDNPNWSAGATLSVPLTRRQERFDYKSGKAQAEQLKLSYKQLEQQVMVDIENAVSLVKINLQRVEATRQEREFAEAALDAEEKKLDVGKSTSFIVLQLQRDLTASRSNEINALSEYNKALAQLSLNEGSVYDRHEILVKEILTSQDNVSHPLLEPVFSE
jgi:outer membrane protein